MLAPLTALDHGDASVADATLAALLGAPAAPLFGNDGVRGGRGTDPLPLGRTPARLCSQDLVVALSEREDCWRVSARYELENPTDAPVRLPLALPAAPVASDAGDRSPRAGQLWDLTAMARGVELATYTISGPPAAGDVLGLALLLAPGERVTLSLGYAFDRSTGVDWWGPDLLSRAGRLWGGPLEYVKVAYHLPRPVWSVSHPRELAVTAFVERPLDEGGALTEVVLEARGFVPLRDLSVRFPGPALAAWTPEGLAPGLESDASFDELKPAFAALSDAHLRACRRHLLALHGALEVPPDHPAVAAPDWAAAAGLVATPRPMNPDFALSWLSSGERAWLAALEAARRP